MCPHRRGATVFPIGAVEMRFDSAWAPLSSVTRPQRNDVALFWVSKRAKITVHTEGIWWLHKGIGKRVPIPVYYSVASTGT
jgi:hypothetical protein